MRERVLEPELMDDPGLDSGEHRRALRGLSRLNRVSFAAGPFIARVGEVSRRLGRALRLVDVACGSGDVSVAVARRSGVVSELVLVDSSERAIEIAKERAERMGVRSAGVVTDVVRGELPACDIAMCSLFFHHLDGVAAETVLRRMRDASAAAVVVSDLRRGGWGTGLARVFPRLLTRSPVVHTDAVLSARAAWSEPEFRDLSRQAGLEGAEVRRRFPARMELFWDRGS